jgi:phosphoribosylglycinamide formyltransferase-1
VRNKEENLIKNSKKKKTLIKIILVISNNPDAEGLKYASRSKIKIYGIKNKSNFENKSLKLLKKYNIDMLCLAGFMRILSGNFFIKLPDKILINPAKQSISMLYFFNNLSDLFSKFDLFLIP